MWPSSLAVQCVGLQTLHGHVQSAASLRMLSLARVFPYSCLLTDESENTKNRGSDAVSDLNPSLLTLLEPQPCLHENVPA